MNDTCQDPEKTIDLILSDQVQEFIRAHENDDVAKLALTLNTHKSTNPTWPYREILEQIKARQKAKIKMPSWLEKNIIFPSPDIIEQASSEACAKYKKSIITSGQNFADLTAGSGCDSFEISNIFEHTNLVEINKINVIKLIRNSLFFKRKSTKNSIVITESSAEKFVEEMEDKNFIFIDPARRDEHKKGHINLTDYQPNILELLPILAKKTEAMLIKTSPMIDLWEATKDLKYVNEIHIVEWRGECKEVLFHLDFKNAPTPPESQIPITAVQINDEGKPIHKFTFTKHDEQQATAPIGPPQNYLFEPGPALMKSGGFNLIAHKHGLTKLHPHTHIYTSTKEIKGLSGRSFTIQNITQVNRKAISAKKANLTTRNFPEDVATLRKKLKLKEGGNLYIFACTDHENKKILIHCTK